MKIKELKLGDLIILDRKSDYSWIDKKIPYYSKSYLPKLPLVFIKIKKLYQYPPKIVVFHNGEFKVIFGKSISLFERDFRKIN